MEDLQQVLQSHRSCSKRSYNNRNFSNPSWYRPRYNSRSCSSPTSNNPSCNSPSCNSRSCSYSNHQCHAYAHLKFIHARPGYCHSRCWYFFTIHPFFHWQISNPGIQIRCPHNDSIGPNVFGRFRSPCQQQTTTPYPCQSPPFPMQRWSCHVPWPGQVGW